MRSDSEAAQQILDEGSVLGHRYLHMFCVAQLRMQQSKRRFRQQLDRMEDVQLTAQPVGQDLRRLDDGIVQHLGLAMDVGRVHTGDDASSLP